MAEKDREEKVDKITRLIRMLRKAENASSISDLHIVQNEKAWVRVDGKLEQITDFPIITDEDIKIFLENNVFRHSNITKVLDADNYVSTSIHDPVFGDVRVHLQRVGSKSRLIIRLLNAKVPDINRLNLPEAIKKLANFPNGLVLFTGATGSGKSTALAALINEINKKYEFSIYTVEDPVEYKHKSIKSLVTHLSVGTDVNSYAAGIRSLLRADPDVILIGEMRDVETMEAALRAAETGHLVFSTLHDNGATETCSRIIGSFDGERQNQIKQSFASVMRGVVSLRLLPSTSDGRVPACEIMLSNDAIRGQIKKGDFQMLRATILSSKEEGMQTLESDLSRLVDEGIITLETAREAANVPEDVKPQKKI